VDFRDTVGKWKSQICPVPTQTERLLTFPVLQSTPVLCRPTHIVLYDSNPLVSVLLG
jgi:hypothetical protein